MSNLRVKLFAFQSPCQRVIKLEGFDFVADGLELAYNCMILFSVPVSAEKSIVYPGDIIP